MIVASNRENICIFKLSKSSFEFMGYLFVYGGANKILELKQNYLLISSMDHRNRYYELTITKINLEEIYDFGEEGEEEYKKYIMTESTDSFMLRESPQWDSYYEVGNFVLISENEIAAVLEDTYLYFITLINFEKFGDKYHYLKRGIFGYNSSLMMIKEKNILLTGDYNGLNLIDVVNKKIIKTILVGNSICTIKLLSNGNLLLGGKNKDEKSILIEYNLPSEKVIRKKDIIDSN